MGGKREETASIIHIIIIITLLLYWHCGWLPPPPRHHLYIPGSGDVERNCDRSRPTDPTRVQWEERKGKEMC